MAGMMETGADATWRIFDAIEIDTAGRRLFVNGSEVPLEPKAFDALLLLVERAGHVCTREELLDAVWGHRHITPSVLSRVITMLRHALGEQGDEPRYLHTVHGIGYRFDAAVRAVARPRARENGDAAAATGVFEMSPAPVDRALVASPPANPPTVDAVLPAPARTSWRSAALVMLPLAALLVFAGWKWWRHAPTQIAAEPQSIAVLPLANASPAVDQQFFSDGLSDNLIDALSRFDGLKVIGRMSSFQFRGGKDDSKTIGAKLGADYLVGGSVQRADETVRISAALTRAADGSTLWAEHYDRPYKDLFALQDEIAQAIATALHARLRSASSAAAQSDRPPSGNIEAYDAYLQGLKHSRDQNFPEAAKYMTQAVQLDPGYALAWAYLSGSLSTIATFSNEAAEVAREHTRTARLAADEALRRAPGLGMAHAARAYLEFYNFDSQGALAGCRHAVQLAPDDVTILNGCGYTLAGIGKLAEAIRLRERVLSIEPLYSVNHWEYARLLTASGRLDEATKYLHIAEGLSRMESRRRYPALFIAIVRGDADAALEIAAQAPAANRDLYMMLATQIGLDRAAADAALAKVLANDAEAGNSWSTRPYHIAQAYALRGDPDRAMEWLARASTHDFLFLLADPLILRFRDDPRLIAFCAKIGLPPPAASEALSLERIRAANSAGNH